MTRKLGPDAALKGSFAVSELLKEIGGYVLLVLAIFAAPLLAAVIG